MQIRTSSVVRIRFVGGPWHNRFEDLELKPVVILRQVQPQTKVSFSYGGCFAGSKVRHDEYYLARYNLLNSATYYYQYVHSTLVSSGKAALSTCHEELPAWTINRRQLESRLRKAMKKR